MNTKVIKKTKLRFCSLILATLLTSLSIWSGMTFAEEATAVTGPEMTAQILVSGDTKEQEKRPKYDFNIPSNVEVTVSPLKIADAGILQVFFTDKSENVEVSFFSDGACTKEINYNENHGYAIIPVAGTYYVRFENSFGDYGDETVKDLPVQFSCQLFTSRSVELKNNVWQASGVLDYTKPLYQKLNVSKTALVEIDFAAENTNSNLTICDANKKPITSDTTISSLSGKKAFTLSKGTYYIKATTNAYWVRMKANEKSVSDVSGSSKSKATSISIGSSKEGYMLLTDKTSNSDWFKFTLSKPERLNLVLGGNVSAGYIRYELTSTSIKGALTGYLGDVGGVDTHPLKYVNSKGLIQNEMPKGTYYLRLFKDSPKTCGNYIVKIVKG